MTESKSEVPLFAPPGHFYSLITHPKANRRYFWLPHSAAQTARVDAMLYIEAMVETWLRIASQILGFSFERSPEYSLIR